MELTYLGIVLCLLLLAIPACLLFVYDEQLLARGTVAVGFYLLMAVARVHNPLQATLLVPVMALLIGHAAAVEASGMSAWLQARNDYREQYEFRRGNGASHLKALAPAIRSALQQGLAPTLGNARGVGLFALPLLFCALLLAGIAPLQALAWTVSLLVGSLAASVLAIVVSLWVSDRLLSSSKPSQK